MAVHTPTTKFVKVVAGDGTDKDGFVTAIWYAPDGTRDPENKIAVNVFTNGAADALILSPSPSDTAPVICLRGVPYGTAPGCWHF